MLFFFLQALERKLIPSKITHCLLVTIKAGRPVFFLGPVSFTNRFAGTGFCLKNRFKVN
jgi:hypothetical protein